MGITKKIAQKLRNNRPRHKQSTNHHKVHKKIAAAMVSARRKTIKKGIYEDFKMKVEIDRDSFEDKNIVTYTTIAEYPKDLKGIPWV